MYPLLHTPEEIYRLTCRFCDLVFQGPLSVQEDWIKHLQRHIMNTAVPHTGAGMVEVTSLPKDSCPNTIPQAQPSVMQIPSWAQEHTKLVLGISLVCELFGSHLNFILPSVRTSVFYSYWGSIVITDRFLDIVTLCWCWTLSKNVRTVGEYVEISVKPTKRQPLPQILLTLSLTRSLICQGRFMLYKNWNDTVCRFYIKPF